MGLYRSADEVESPRYIKLTFAKRIAKWYFGGRYSEPFIQPRSEISLYAYHKYLLGTVKVSITTFREMKKHKKITIY